MRTGKEKYRHLLRIVRSMGNVLMDLVKLPSKMEILTRGTFSMAFSVVKVSSLGPMELFILANLPTIVSRGRGHINGLITVHMRER